MRIHTDKVDAVRTAIYRATGDLPGVYADVTEHGSRSRAGALELRATADPRPGRRPTNSGRFGTGNDYGATWDEWGTIFAAIFAADPNATCYAYDGADHYHWATGNRFATDDGRPVNHHDQHRWEYAGAVATGAYVVHECKGRKGEPCPAIRRVVRGGDLGVILGRD